MGKSKIGKIATVAALGATGFGLAGMGPMAGMLGTAPTGAAAGTALGSGGMFGMGLGPMGLTVGTNGSIFGLGGGIANRLAPQLAMRGVGMLGQEPPMQPPPGVAPVVPRTPSASNLANIQSGGQIIPLAMRRAQIMGNPYA